MQLNSIQHRADKRQILPEDDATAILGEQTALLYKSLPVSISASFLNVLILAGLLADRLNLAAVYIWVGLSLLVTVYRAVIWRAYNKRDSSTIELKTWTKLFNLGVVFTGVTWSLPCTLIFSSLDIVHQTFLAFIVAGISAGSVSSLAYLQFPIRVFLSLLLVPLAIRYFMLGNLVALAMGFLTSLFYVFNLRSASSFYASNLQNLQLRLKAAHNERIIRQSEENSRALLNSVPVGVFNYNNDGVITNCNATLSRMLNRPATQIMGFQLIDKKHPHDEFTLALQKSLSEGKANFLGKTQILQLGTSSKIRALMRGLRDAQNNIIGGVCVVEDLTDEERIDRLKNEFVSTVSHELRTPLTAIIGSLRLLSGGAISLYDIRAKTMIEMALHNSDRLHGLINNLLDINKLEQHQIDYSDKEINLLKLAKEAIESNKGLEVSHRVQLCLDRSSESVSIKGDRHRLLQAVNNLISNAAKFSPRDGLIVIRVGVHQGKAIITVHDSGPGIAPIHHQDIFEKFYQIDSASNRKFEGSGLGLSISKAIVKQHAGNIRVQSQEGSGATFILEFPLYRNLQQVC